MYRSSIFPRLVNRRYLETISLLLSAGGLRNVFANPIFVPRIIRREYETVAVDKDS